ncbi:hypothetical protein SUDANB51_01903 [Streptomyces sp. enrichment culture]|nr:hypothetical protein DF19_00385 [Streptomyces olindensis]
MTPVDPASVSSVRSGLLAAVEERLAGVLKEELNRWSAHGERAVVPVGEVASLVRAGGKRLRPLFCVSGYLAAGGAPDAPEIVDAAAALEFLHTCALLHDDVADGARLRRGLPTAHARHAEEHRAQGWNGEPRRFGESVAVLAGDLALAYADRLMAGLPPEVKPIWDELRIELIVGEYLDVDTAVRGEVTPELARWIAVWKSGSYTVRRPLEIGAAVAGRSDLAPAFETYGEKLGEAFQLRDDLIGVADDSERSGKSAGHGWDAAALRGRMAANGGAAEVERRIEQLTEEACAAVRTSSLDPVWQREFADMAFRAAYRDR